MAMFAVISGVMFSGCPMAPARPVYTPPLFGGPQPDIDPRPLGGNRRPKVLIPPGSRVGNPWKPRVTERDWKSIVIHHTATNRGSVAGIHATHKRRKDASGKPWLGIGYHFVIGNGNGMEDGEIEETFRWRTQIHGAHAGNKEHNQHGIGIALIGNFEKTPPTRAQLASIKKLVAVLKREYNIPAKKVVGHSKIRATACPGKLFPLADVAASGSERLFGRIDRQTHVRTAGYSAGETR